MKENKGCANCIGYLIREHLLESMECEYCYQMTREWIQFQSGTYGCICSNCGMSMAVDLNTECELDQVMYSITIRQQKMSKQTLLKLCKLTGKNALETNKAMSSGPIVLEGDLAYAWETKKVLDEICVEYVMDPGDMEDRYFYAGKCGYCYARIGRQ